MSRTGSVVAYADSQDEQLALLADVIPDRDALLHLIAKVMVWEWGVDADKIADEARGVVWQDYARRCARDLGLA